MSDEYKYKIHKPYEELFESLYTYDDLPYKKYDREIPNPLPYELTLPKKLSFETIPGNPSYVDMLKKKESEGQLQDGYEDLEE